MNKTKTLISVYGTVLAYLIFVFTWCYGVAHGTMLSPCGGNDPRTTAPYSLSDCKDPLTFLPCTFTTMDKNYKARLKYNEECIERPVKQKGNN